MKVRLSFPYNWPIFRQSPEGLGEWGNYKFYLDNENCQEFDAWFVFDKLGKSKESAICNPNAIFLLAPEPFPVKPYYKKFVNQFKAVISCQTELKHHNNFLGQTGAPWFVNKSYDELINMTPVLKTKKISVITSNKLITEGHKRRFEYVMKLKEYFTDEIDLFGRGVKDFDDKWNVLAPYQYSIAIENGNHEDYFTEKISDCFLSFTFPLYNGCRNLNKYFNENSYKTIDIQNFEEALIQIEKILNSENHYNNHLDLILESRRYCLEKYNFFALISDFLDKMQISSNEKQMVTLNNQFYDPCTLMEKLSNKIKHTIL